MGTQSSNNKPGGLTRHLPASAAVKPPELIDQPYWSADEFVNKSLLPAKLVRFDDVNDKSSGMCLSRVKLNACLYIYKVKCVGGGSFLAGSPNSLIKLTE